MFDAFLANHPLWNRFLSHKTARTALIALVSTLLFSILYVALVDPLPSALEESFENLPPGPPYWFGAILKRDFGYTVTQSFLLSFSTALIFALLCSAIGMAVGCAVAMNHSPYWRLLIELGDILGALNLSLLGMLCFFNFKISLIPFKIGMAFLSWGSTARRTIDQLRPLQHREYVDLYRMLNVSKSYLCFYHFFPQILPVVSLHFIMQLRYSIFMEGILTSFCITTNTPVWCRVNWHCLGNLIYQYRTKLFDQTALDESWLFYIPMFFFLILMVSLNFIAEGVRNVQTPSSR